MDLPTPLHIIQDSRYAKQDGWRLDDISLCSSGNIAVSGHNYPYRYQSYVSIYGSTTTDDNSDSRDKPTLLYHKQFTEKLSWPPWLPRCISFIKPNSTEIVTCRDDEVQVIDYNRDVVLRSRKVDGETSCLSVSESQIFIGLEDSDIVNIYDNDLNRIKSIRLKGIGGDWPWDIAAAADRLYTCIDTGRAIVYSQDSGSILTEYTIGQDRRAWSITVNIQLQIVAVLWNINCSKKQVAVYSFSNNNCLVVFDVESGVSRIRISDKGRIVTGNEGTGESKIYKLGDIFVYNLSAKLAQLMSSDEIKELRKHFNVLATEEEESSVHTEDTLKKKKNAYKVLMILKERGILYPNKANDLKTLFDNLGDLTTSKLSGPIHLYQKFSNVYADIQEQEQPKAGAGRLNDSFSVTPSHEIPERRFPKQDNWCKRNVVNVVSTTHGLVCYIRSGKKTEPNVLTELCKLPNLDSSENPQIIYSKIVSRQGIQKLFLTFIDETRLVMCYNKTLEIIDINSKEVVRGHQLRAAAKTIDVDEGEMFIVVGDSSEVLVFNPDLEEIKKLTFTLEDWKYPADMKVTSERLFIICKVKPRDHDRFSNWPDKAMSFRREDGEVEAYYIFPGERYTQPVSIAAHKESEFVGVLWSRTQTGLYRRQGVTTCMVSVHSFSGCCVFLLDVAASHTIQILNKNTMIVINQTYGLKFYNMAHFFTFNILALRLSSFITLPECTGLQNFYGISDDEINRKDSGSSHFPNLTSVRRRFLCLFKILEEKDMVGPCKFDDFIATDAKVRAPLLWSHVEDYLKLQDIMQRASLKAAPSVQIHVPVTQQGGTESLDNVICQEETSAQSHSFYPGGSHLHSGGSTSLQPQQQNPRQLHQQANLEAQQHDEGYAAAFQQEQVAQQQPAVTLEQQAQQHADQQAVRQQSVLHQQQFYQQLWQQNQAYQEQSQVHQGLGRGYIQAQQYHQPVGYSPSLGFNQPQSAFAQRPSFQQLFKRPTEPFRQPLPAIYSQEQGVLHNQQQAAYNAQTYSQLPDESTFVQHQQEQYAELPYQQEHIQQIQQQQLQQYPPYQSHTSLQHQVVAPSHDELGQQAFPEQMTGRHGTISLSSFQHHQQELQYQPGSGPLPAIEGSTVRDKRSLFVECLKKKITSLSEMNYFAPWENFSRWKSTDLFVGCWLTLNDTNSMATVKNIENECKLKYIEIFTHERLKSETRIIIEGGPGTGKTMLLAQLALKWCEGNIEDVDTLIFLPLKIVVDKTLIQAIKEFYIPENTPLSGNDIADILASDTERICLLLDGLEEYSGGGEMRAKESSDVRKVIKKEKYPNCKVVVTCRSHLMHDLSDGPLLKIGQFGETERKFFIEKLALDNIKKEEKMKQIIEDDSFLLGLCSIPLLFALAVHNIVNMSFAGDSHLEKVAPFVKNMIETLWALSISRHETWSESEQLILGELAFNGLCKGQQHFSWRMDFIETKISRLKHWIDSRILVVERGMTVHPTEKYHEQGRETQSSEATVAIRFLHEIIQEWFAATHLCYMMKYYTDEDQFHEYVIKKLNQLSPKSRHYVLRFTSYLHPRSCHAIINYLLSNFLSDDGSIEPHVMDCICLCFAEHNDIKGTDMKNSVTEVCKEVITIDFEDGRFLQRAKSFLLQYASDCGATINEIQLSNVISNVDETSLTLNSGTKLGQLDTLQVIEVSQWEQVLHQDDFENILKFLSKGTSIKTILCVFPCHPPKILDEEIIENVFSKNLEVEWKYGEVTWTLDLKKQIFNPMFGIMTKDSQIELKDKEDDFKSHEQFLMSLPGTSSTPFGKWPTKRPLSKMLHPDMKLDIAAKRLKVDWDPKVKSAKEYKKEEVLDLSKDSILEPSTAYVEEKFVKEETHSPGVAQPLIKKERSESDSEQKFWTVSPASAHEQSQDTGSYIARKTIITKVGGTLEISNTGILLVIPPNALPADKEEHDIYMRYIPRREVEDEVKCFSSNSTAVVEILPNLCLQHPVRLSLPHCLVLQQHLERKAKIFESHHEKGTHPVWEEQKDLSYHIEDTTCIILLNSFSWYKYCIDDEIVIAKKIVVYTAARKPKPHDDIVQIEVGCYPDLPGQEKDIPGDQTLIVAHKKILYFVKSKKQHPLQISLTDIFPSEWQCHHNTKFTDSLSQKIPYSKISKEFGDSCVFILEKQSHVAGMPLCVFTASQEKDVEMDNVAVQLAVNFQVIDKVSSTTGVTGYQLESSLKAEATLTKSGVKLEIPGTGVVLKIPPNALERNSETHLIGMRIIPSRIIEDKVTSLSSNACTAVEVYPHTISLRQPVELRLPHCLTFNENSNLSARVFTNYQKGSPAKWEKDTKLTYKLDERACMITLNKLCCVQYIIDDKIVEDKKVKVYTAAKKLEQMDEIAELEVGFFLDIPGGGELLRMNPNFVVDSKKLLLMGKEKSPLQLSLENIAPSLWECWFPKNKPQNIPVKVIAASIEHSSLFILKKTSNKVGSAICTFTSLPKKGPMSLEMALTVCPQPMFGTMTKPGQTELKNKEGHHERSFLQAQATINESGGTIEIPNTGVVLRVPPDALPKDRQECLIKMRIIPVRMSYDEATSFCSNSSVTVELLPNHFKFRCHIELTLPHCLKLKQNVHYRGKVFMSHHNEGERPQWEEQNEQFYDLREKTCIILLKSFCWIKFEIDNEIVEGKRLELYTAAKKMYLTDQSVAVHVGYRLDMPGEQEIPLMNPNLILQQRHRFLFLKEGHHPLLVRLERIIPQQWTYLQDENPKEIPFKSIAASIEDYCIFLVEKQTDDHSIPMCMFVASQKQRIGKRVEERTEKLMIRPEHYPNEGIVQSQQMKPNTDSMIATFQFLAKNLSNEWKPLGRKLCLEEPDIYFIERDFRRTEAAVYQMLQCWRKTQGSSATYALLVTALKQVGRKDLAEKVQHVKDVFEEC